MNTKPNPNNNTNNNDKKIYKKKKVNSNINKKPTMRTEQFLKNNNANVVTYTNPNQFRKVNINNLLTEMNMFNKHMRDRYLVGLIHPDIAVKDGLSPKLYHDIPIPTSTYGIYGSYTGTTNALGNCLISIATPGQPGQTEPMRHISFNNNNSLTGSAVVNGNVFQVVLPAINVPTQRYRLVSSLTRVSYTGKLLDQAGKFYSCATYETFNIKYGPNASQVNADRYGVFSIIKNGLWNTTVDVTSPEHAIECLWVPTDNYNYMFQKQYAYGGTSSNGTTSEIGPSVDGAFLGYVVACQGLPPNAACVTVECWANYELIADASVAPFMNHSVDTVWTQKDRDVVSSTITSEMKDNGLIRSPQKSMGWKEVISSIADVGIPILAKLLSMF